MICDYGDKSRHSIETARSSIPPKHGAQTSEERERERESLLLAWNFTLQRRAPLLNWWALLCNTRRDENALPPLLTHFSLHGPCYFIQNENYGGYKSSLQWYCKQVYIGAGEASRDASRGDQNRFDASNGHSFLLLQEETVYNTNKY